MSRKKEQVVCTSMTFFCDKLGKEITIPKSELEFIARDDTCELCGSHGIIKVHFVCKCKTKFHIVELDFW